VGELISAKCFRILVTNIEDCCERAAAGSEEFEDPGLKERPDASVASVVWSNYGYAPDLAFEKCPMGVAHGIGFGQQSSFS
jgi:hypothetical protein